MRHILLTLMLILPLFVKAQKEVNVHGTYSYIIDLENNISFAEAKRLCLQSARAEAIKEAFGEFVTSDVLVTEEYKNDQAESHFWENTVLQAKGDWLGDTKEPDFDAQYIDGKLVFKAEVWGTAREITQSKIDLDWNVLVNGTSKNNKDTNFKNRQNIYVRLKSPVKGYAAVYLLESSDETYCLLPYREDNDGRFDISPNREYVFFDRDSDPAATQYTMTTRKREETNQIVLIFSPHPFTKCNLTQGNDKRADYTSTIDFQKWLLGCQRLDKDMVVCKEWITIKNDQAR